MLAIDQRLSAVWTRTASQSTPFLAGGSGSKRKLKWDPGRYDPAAEEQRRREGAYDAGGDPGKSWLTWSLRPFLQHLQREGRNGAVFVVVC
eukprot:COSAG01_NODE_11821_length_1853_cov_1.941277_3_plen_91_part_00